MFNEYLLMYNIELLMSYLLFDYCFDLLAICNFYDSVIVASINSVTLSI